LNEFETWFTTFIEEKGLSDITLEFEEKKSWNYLPISVLKEFLFSCNNEIQQKIKNKLVELDFCNMSIAHFLEHVAKGMVKIYHS
jgi:hypothetical protein